MNDNRKLKICHSYELNLIAVNSGSIDQIKKKYNFKILIKFMPHLLHSCTLVDVTDTLELETCTDLSVCVWSLQSRNENKMNYTRRGEVVVGRECCENTFFTFNHSSHTVIHA